MTMFSHHLLFPDFPIDQGGDGYYGRKSINIHFLLKSPYGSDSPGRGKWSKCGIFSFFLKLCCDQTVRFFQLFSTVLKRFCPLDAKNVSVLVLAIFFWFSNFHCFYPQLAILVHQSAMMVMMICRTIISQTSNSSSSKIC